MAQLSGGIVVNLCNVLLYFLLCRKVDTFQRIVARGQLVVSRGQTLFRAGALALILKAITPLRGIGSGHARLVSLAVMERQPGAYYDLDAQLTKHKPNLISLLQHAVSSRLIL